ncbi:MAG: Zn-dependent hydrolase [halophilic archaeon J07HB67]|jgi:Zn-dependent hydrolases, including glyoxylases|nr:MAG: Zn-dependent hydrolase [halophilic archaeon J07HB67]
MHVDTFSVPVTTGAPTGQTNAVLFDDGERLLVDPAARSASLDTAVAGGLDHVAVTHPHPDHVGAVADYAAETDATVWARRGQKGRFRDATGVAPDRTFVGGDRVGPATAMDTPGHTPDHVAFQTPAGVAVGDLAVAEGSVAVAAPEGDVRAYLSSLRRLSARDPPRLFPAHGPAVDDPPAVCRRLIDHRLDRERRIAAAVTDGARSVDAVVDAAYDKSLDGVRELAVATVEAHLEKLHRAGQVRWDRERDRVHPA